MTGQHGASTGLRFVWDDQAGKLRPLPMGAEGENDPKPPDPPAPKQGDPDEPKTLSQDEVNRIAAREKQQGREAAMREVSDQLGVPVEEAKRIIDAAQAAKDAQKTEAERARDEAEAEKAAAAADRQTAAREIHESRVDRALLFAGYDATADEEGEKLTRLRRMVNVEPGATLEDVQADVAKIAEGFPELFARKGGGTPPAPPRAPSTTPGGTPPKRQAPEGAMARGAERAKQFTGHGGVTYDT